MEACFVFEGQDKHTWNRIFTLAGLEKCGHWFIESKQSFESIQNLAIFKIPCFKIMTGFADLF